MEINKNNDTNVKAKTVSLKAKGKSLTGKPLDDIELNPQLDSKRQVNEQSRGGVVLTFGRMNPPTVGHEKLVKKVVDVANSKRATPMIFLSHSQDKKKNPLEYADKIRFAKKAFGNLVQASPARTMIDVAKNLQNKFKELTVVVGSDRVQEFETLLNKYNGKEFNFDKITVVSAGERDPDAEGVEGMSASKMRAAVQSGDKQKFISGLPASLKRHGAEVYDLVMSGMKLHEELEAQGLLSEVLDINQRRQRAVLMKRYSAKIARAKEIAKKRLATNEKLKKRAFIQARDIVRKRVAGKRGEEYHTLSPSEKIQVDKLVEKRKGAIKKIAARIMPRVKAAEFERLRSFMKGDQLAHMHSGPSSQHEQFNQMFEQVVSTVEMTTVDDILQEMTNLVLDKIITEKQIKSLHRKSQRSGIEFEILEHVYVRGLLDSMGDQAAAFNRVNAFVCGGRTAMNEDADLYQMTLNRSKPSVNKANVQEDINEDLRNWFDQKWVRMDTKGEIKGDCAREEGEGKPKCLPLAKARAMDKEDRATAARRKRREDPVADRPGKGGKPVNVRTEETSTSDLIRKSHDKRGAPGTLKAKIDGPITMAKVRALKNRPDATALDKRQANFYINMQSEQVEDLQEKNTPTNPELWSRAKSLARQKFDVYPSAYANGWAAKWYKSKGGSWKGVSESKQGVNESLNTDHYKALTDIELNTKNRDMTTKNDGYGPLNPSDAKGSKKFWEEKAEMWNTTVDAAKASLCGNCAAFNQSKEVMDKIAEGLGPEGEKISNLANLGFCEIWEFKCAAARTCNVWLLGGPIKEDLDLAFENAMMPLQHPMKRHKNETPSDERRELEYMRRGPDSPDEKEEPDLIRRARLQVKKKVIDEEGNSQPNPRKRLMGTDSLVKAYKKDTPGESLDESFNIAFAAGIGVSLTAADMGMKAAGGFALHPSVVKEMQEREEELEETAKSADKHPVVVPSHKDAHGNVIPAKTVLRKRSAPIVNTGDNPSDGQ